MWSIFHKSIVCNPFRQALAYSMSPDSLIVHEFFSGSLRRLRVRDAVAPCEWKRRVAIAFRQKSIVECVAPGRLDFARLQRTNGGQK
jgi:hypothetical protein